MDLDKRIKNNHRPLCVIDIKWAMGFIGKNGFFADNVEDKKMFPFECDDKRKYTFFIPEEWVEPKEEKYRAYTLEEFLEAMESGLFESWITMRPVGSKKECQFLYTGYQETEAGEYICLGCFQFDFISLFKNYEIQDLDGKWHPFGVLDEEKE